MQLTCKRGRLETPHPQCLPSTCLPYRSGRFVPSWRFNTAPRYASELPNNWTDSDDFTPAPLLNQIQVRRRRVGGHATSSFPDLDVRRSKTEMEMSESPSKHAPVFRRYLQMLRCFLVGSTSVNSDERQTVA